MEQYLNLLTKFQQWNPFVISEMKKCSHHFDTDNLSPFHLEGDVWTHTLLAYKDFMLATKTGTPELILPIYNVERYFYLLAITILCHDIGKIYNRHVPNNQYGKIAFYNHSFSSVQGTIDFIYYLKEPFTSEEVLAVLSAISNHMDWWDADIENQMLLSNNTLNNLSLLNALNIFDKRNSIDTKGEFVTKTNAKLEHYSEDLISYNFADEGHEITLYCGTPGVGKDYIAANNHGENLIVSYDDIRVSLYLEAFPDEIVKPPAVLYAKAWEYIKKENINLNPSLVKRMQPNGAICNTNLTRKLRQSTVRLFPDAKIKIVYVISSSENIFKRNNERQSKTIKPLVVNQFLYNQQIPSLFEFKKTKAKITSIELHMN